ncbi:hypothetical protein B4U79_18160 [Dinothrombium tinctorium]|uniref:Envelope glycoprotein H n=1 Tax=Dinothrombium tinctorium TaxID=1965070 RepID=A0A443QZU0_9ACAR|nr:hypothetical protein B4U79_18160 [Dinothrombium tinctorium]
MTYFNRLLVLFFINIHEKTTWAKPRLEGSLNCSMLKSDEMIITSMWLESNGDVYVFGKLKESNKQYLSKLKPSSEEWSEIFEKWESSGPDAVYRSKEKLIFIKGLFTSLYKQDGEHFRLVDKHLLINETMFKGLFYHLPMHGFYRFSSIVRTENFDNSELIYITSISKVVAEHLIQVKNGTRIGLPYSYLIKHGLSYIFPTFQTEGAFKRLKDGVFAYFFLDGLSIPEFLSSTDPNRKMFTSETISPLTKPYFTHPEITLEYLWFVPTSYWFGCPVDPFCFRFAADAITKVEKNKVIIFSGRFAAFVTAMNTKIGEFIYVHKIIKNAIDKSTLPLFHIDAAYTDPRSKSIMLFKDDSCFVVDYKQGAITYKYDRNETFKKSQSPDAALLLPYQLYLFINKYLGVWRYELETFPYQQLYTEIQETKWITQVGANLPSNIEAAFRHPQNDDKLFMVSNNFFFEMDKKDFNKITKEAKIINRNELFQCDDSSLSDKRRNHINYVRSLLKPAKIYGLTTPTWFNVTGTIPTLPETDSETLSNEKTSRETEKTLSDFPSIIEEQGNKQKITRVATIAGIAACILITLGLVIGSAMHAMTKRQESSLDDYFRSRSAKRKLVNALRAKYDKNFRKRPLKQRFASHKR